MYFSSRLEARDTNTIRAVQVLEQRKKWYTNVKQKEMLQTDDQWNSVLPVSTATLVYTGF